MMAMTHIQNTLPKPPTHSAVATPMMLPVPTREAVDTMRAWNEDTPLPFFSVTALNCFPSRRNWAKRVRTVK